MPVFNNTSMMPNTRFPTNTGGVSDTTGIGGPAYGGGVAWNPPSGMVMDTSGLASGTMSAPSAQNTGPVANTSLGGSGTGIDWNQILGGIGGLAGAYGSYQSGQNQQQGVGGLLNQRGINQTPFTGPGGTASAGPSGIQTNLTPGLQQNLNNANSLVGNQLGNTGQAGNSLMGATQGANNQLAGLFGGVQGQLGQTGQLMQQGQNVFNNGVTPAANAAALSNIQQGGQNFNSVYQGSLNNILGALQPQQQQQQAALMDQEFGRGQLGTSGGALQTKAMYQGFGQADLAAQQQAYNQALQQQQQNVNAATAYSGIGNNNLQLGGNLMNSAFSNFNQLTGMGGQLASSQFGVNNTNALTQAGLAGYGQQIGNSINQIGMGNAQLAAQVGLGSAQNQTNALHAGGSLAQTQTNQTGNVIGGLLNGLTTGGSNSPLNSILGMLGGGSAGNQPGYDPTNNPDALLALFGNTATPGLGGGAYDPTGGGGGAYDPTTGLPTQNGPADFLGSNFDPFGNPQ